MNELPKGWGKKNLVDCLEEVIDYRGKTPKKSNKGIITLSAKSVKMGRIDYSQAYYISEEVYRSFMVRGFPKKGDILMTTEAPLGCIAKLDRDNISVAQRLLTLRGKNGVLDNNYMMYYLSSRIGQHELHARASGSTVQGIKRSEFKHVKIILPTSYQEQKAIAAVLSAFDEKIELLREHNETLETLAQTFFKEWFVNFNYPG
ncbi:restriction endonuclease subunit S, partial [Desulfobacterales bacterium HSG17]|nr:restriction endonuclease subunit S [Desulfobacterales bacterium HSG17]